MPKKIIYVRVEKDNLLEETLPNNQYWMVTVQVKGYPKTHGFIESLGDTVGIGGDISDVNKVAKEVAYDTRKANPDAKVILKLLKD